MLSCDLRVSYDRPSRNRVTGQHSNQAAAALDAVPVNRLQNDGKGAPCEGLSVADTTASEGSRENARFVVSLEPALTKTVTVRYATSDGTAIGGQDYIVNRGTLLTFAPGETRKTVTVIIVDDLVEDSGETFTLTLSNAVGAPIVDATATGTIFNKEDVPHVTGVELVADASGDGRWTAGETVEVRLTFSEAVTVSGGSPWLEVSVDGFAHNGFLGYASGSGSATLVFSMDVPEGAGYTGLAVVADSLTTNGAGILSAVSGLAAELGHDGTEPTAAPDTEESDSLTADFRDFSVDTHDGATAFTFELRFSEDWRTGLSFATLRDDAFTLENGRITNVRRLESGRNQRWEITIQPGGTDDVVITLPPTADCGDTGAICIGDRLLSEGDTATVKGPASVNENSDPLTADFRDFSVATHDGSTAFTFELRFSEDWTSGLSFATLRDDAFTLENGRITNVRRLESGRNQRWEITVQPGGTDDVAITLAPTADCGDTGAICIGDRLLSEGDTATVKGPASVNENSDPLTADLRDFSVDTHDGSTAFTFELRFSEDWTSGLSFATLRDDAFTLENGRITNVRRLESGRNQRWEITVQPGGTDDVAITLAPTADCGDTGAICIGDRLLSEGDTATVLGPPGLSVADAQVTEDPGVTADFTVTLSRVSTSQVTVNYATADGTGSNAAVAGEDYEETSGTLTFAPGDTEKTVSVTVLDDAVDEGEETFTLTLSNPQGGDAYLKDSTATGTIENTDPMPRAWLSRFGRTAALHVLDAVEERLDGPAGESWVRLGGHRIGGQAHPGAMEALRRQAPEPGLRDEARSLDPLGQDMTPAQLLMGSAFNLASSPDSPGPRLSAWGRVASSGFDASDQDVDLSGTVTTATLGVDRAHRRWLAGLAVAYSLGDGSYSPLAGPGGELESALTSFHPYLGYALSDRVRLWALAGYGAGSLTLAPAGKPAMRADLDLAMGALGARGDVLKTAYGLSLALRSDVLWVSTGSAAAPGMAASRADTSRLRLLVEATRPFAFAGGGLLTPTFQLGLRHDGGDAEEGTGLEAGVSLGYASTFGLAFDMTLSALLTHEAEGYREWGASATLRYDPGRSGLGLSASVTPTWGAPHAGAHRLWTPGLTPEALPVAPGAAASSPAARVDAELGWGLRALNGRRRSRDALCAGHAGGRRRGCLAPGDTACPG